MNCSRQSLIDPIKELQQAGSNVLLTRVPLEKTHGPTAIIKEMLNAMTNVIKKAFDLVPRESLWQVLERRRMSGRVLSSLQSMYKQDKACVLISEGPTEMFECNIGVKQGCPASPLLFSLYLDEPSIQPSWLPGMSVFPSFLVS